MSQPDTRDLVPQDEILPLPASPASMLQSAIERGIGVEGVKALADIYERWEAKRAEREYTEALLAFRAECPPIAKTDKGVHDSMFTPLHKIVAIIDPVLHRHKFTYTWNTLLEEKLIRCTCFLHHTGGHTASATFTAPIDPAPRMTQTHATVSAVSIAKRLSLQMVLGITTGLVDDDGQAAVGGPTISEGDQQVLQKLLDEVKPDMAAFWKYADAPTLAEIRNTDLNRVRAALLQKRKGGGK